MNVGVLEIVLVAIVTVAAAVAVLTTGRRWVLAFPAYFAIAAVCSPADPLSTVLFAVPCCVVYAIGILTTSRAAERAGR